MTRPSTPPIPDLLRGSVLVHRRRCGVPSCHCSDGVSLHESTVLSYSESGRTRFIMLPPETIAPVRRAVQRYQADKARLEERASAGLARLAAGLARARGRS